MSYEKQTWATGDVITAAKLNHMEDGIAGVCGLVVLCTVTAGENDAETYTLNKTYSEISSAFLNGKNVNIYSSGDNGKSVQVLKAFGDNGTDSYWVTTASGSDVFEYEASTASGTLSYTSE